jgi:hypothetical protein
MLHPMTRRIALAETLVAFSRCASRPAPRKTNYTLVDFSAGFMRNSPQMNQSWRSARMGSIRDARSEGIQHATPATTISTSTDVPNASGSVGATS